MFLPGSAISVLTYRKKLTGSFELNLKSVQGKVLERVFREMENIFVLWYVLRFLNVVKVS